MSTDTDELLEGVKILTETVFSGQTVGSEQPCGRALALYVYTYDLCQNLSDFNVTQDVQRLVESAVQSYDVDWTILFGDDDDENDTRIELHRHCLRTFGLLFGLIVLRTFLYIYNPM